MRIKFIKLHGLGNDFILIDKRIQSNMMLENKINADYVDTTWIKELSDRRRGIGFDQLLTLELSSTRDGTKLLYRVFNRDGSIAKQCGNGLRCVASYLNKKGELTNKPFTILTEDDYVTLEKINDNLFMVQLPPPIFSPANIPMNITYTHEQLTENCYSILLDKKEIKFIALSLGNPHAVIRVKDIHSNELAHVASYLQKSAVFPEGVNVGFMQIENKKRIKLRVFERGAGETPACGSGACAAVVAASLPNWIEGEDVTVVLPGGELLISWNQDSETISMCGEAHYVFEGSITY